MQRFAICALILLTPAFAQAWNHTGHMIVAHLAYRDLSPETRHAAYQILAQHPDFNEFLRAGNSEGFSEEEWVFLRAATWPDWVRHGKEHRFNQPTWHYVNLPFVPAGSRVRPESAKEPNVVTEIQQATDQVRQGSPEDRAIYLCWLLHLIGDIHQPLHCTTMFSDQFPRGDEGGNLALIRINGGRPTKLHALWDDLLGSKTTHSAIERVTNQVDEIEQEDRQQLERDLAANREIEQWAQESFNMAVTYAYLEGRLPCANESQHPGESDVPSVPEDYARQAGLIARYQVAKGGVRLAGVLRQVLE